MKRVQHVTSVELCISKIRTRSVPYKPCNKQKQMHMEGCQQTMTLWAKASCLTSHKHLCFGSYIMTHQQSNACKHEGTPPTNKFSMAPSYRKRFLTPDTLFFSTGYLSSKLQVVSTVQRHYNQLCRMQFGEGGGRVFAQMVVFASRQCMATYRMWQCLC